MNEVEETEGMFIDQNGMVFITGDVDTLHMNHADITDPDGTSVRRQCNMYLRNSPVQTVVCRTTLDSGQGNKDDHYLEAIVDNARK